MERIVGRICHQLRLNLALGDKIVEEFDEAGNVIALHGTAGYETHSEYVQGRLVHFRNSYGYEEWRQHDENGREIHFKNSRGDEAWARYDEWGNKIYYKDSKGYEEWAEYNAQGEVIFYHNSDGMNFDKMKGVTFEGKGENQK